MPKKVALDLPDEDDGELKINTAYADRYNDWRGKEEKQRLKDRYGDAGLDSGDEESSEESDEDSDAEELDEETERGILKTLSGLMGKDPRMYDDKFTFFKAKADGGESSKKAVKETPMFLKDYDRKLILEKEGKLSEDESDSDSEERRRREASPSFAQQQELLKKSLKQALKEEEASDDTGLLTKRVRSKEEEAKEEDDYIQWLKGKKKDLKSSEEAAELKPLKEFWTDSKLGEGESFLKDYILNRRYKGGAGDEIPSYDEVTREAEESESEDEEEVDKAEIFEHKYNFRFEEPDPDFIKSYPRTMKDSLRRPDERRKDSREAYKARKNREDEERRAVVGELKALKRREIGDQIAKLRAVSGAALAFDPKDLDGDFDPEAYDKRMQELFNTDYYEAGPLGEEEKPEWGPDSDLDDDNDADRGDWDEWDPEQASTSQPKKGKKKIAKSKPSEAAGPSSKADLAEILQKPKPVFDPKKKTFAEYLDEYYALEAEGFAGGQPTRFHYRQVEANDFGLDVDEILTAPDKELNAWVSLKKACQYRSKEEERFDKDAYQRKAQDHNKKKRVLPTVYKPSARKDSSSDSDDDGEPNIPKTPNDEAAAPPVTSEKKKRRQKKKKSKAASSSVDAKAAEEEEVGVASDAVPPKKEKKEKKKGKEDKTEKKRAAEAEPRAKKRKTTSKADAAFTDDRLKAYGLNPKKVNNRRKYGPQRD